MTPDYELQEHQAQILTDHRMKELASIDTHQTTLYNLREYYKVKAEPVHKWSKSNENKGIDNRKCLGV